MRVTKKQRKNMPGSSTRAVPPKAGPSMTFKSRCRYCGKVIEVARYRQFTKAYNAHRATCHPD